MRSAVRLLNRHLVPALTALSENTYLAAVRAGMVSVAIAMLVYFPLARAAERQRLRREPDEGQPAGPTLWSAGRLESGDGAHRR